MLTDIELRYEMEGEMPPMAHPANDTFSSFLNRMRTKHGVTLRTLASTLGVSAPYLYDVEQGNRNPLKKEHLEKLAQFFALNSEETAYMFDLAGIDRGIVPLDLPEYIISNPYVRVALRKARNMNLKEEEWQRFIAQIGDLEDQT